MTLLLIIALSLFSINVLAEEDIVSTAECEKIRAAAIEPVDSASIERFNQSASIEARQRCIVHILTQPATRIEFTLFKQWVQMIIAMDLPNQQSILDSVLDSYVVNDKQALEHRYVEELLIFGANPAAKNSAGTHVLGEAFWATYVGGGTCETIRLIIGELSSEDLTIPYPNRPSGYPEQNIGATPLMSMANLGLYCPAETLLVAERAAEIDRQDKNGNTALHHFYFDMMGKAFLSGYQIELIEILRKRGASFEIPNDDDVTANQLRLKLKQNLKLCEEFCDLL